MTHGAPSRPPEGAATPTIDGTTPSPVPGLLRVGLHLFIAGLLVLAAGRALVDRGPGWPWVVAATVLVGAVYAFGPRSRVVAGSPRAAGVWLIVLLAAWVVLLVLTPDAIYLAFPWFFLLLHLLPRAVGLVGVGVVTVAAVAGFAWHQKSFTAPMAIGPALGAMVAVATVLGYQALQAESEQRRRLIIELDRTRSELADSEHRAGVLSERERLAREIHDTLAQGLSSIQLLLQAANRHLDPARAGAVASDAAVVDPRPAAGLVEQARLAAQDNLAEARRFVRALAPGALEESTLASALQRLCDTTSARTGMVVTFHEEGPATTLPTPVEVALLRIAQGALGNAEQHSRATQVHVTLTTMDAAVTLDIVDDGVGFDPARRGTSADAAGHAGVSGVSGAAAASGAAGAPGVAAEAGLAGGYGLQSMRSRTAELGGRLTVESQPGHGTAVSVHLDRVGGAPSGATS